MRFPAHGRLDLPCVLEGLLPGRPHPDGRRYLPLLLLRPTAPTAPAGLLLGVVDRHHYVREADQGRAGSARLVCALSALRLQRGERRGVEVEAGARGGVSTAPDIYGQVREVLAWEVGSPELPYQSLYVELLLDVGVGVVGLRTSLTAPDTAAALGKARIEAGDFVALERSRIDILGFDVAP